MTDFSDLSPMFADQFEPPEIVKMMNQSINVVGGANLNPHRADYFWVDVKGNERQWERKQVAEAMGDLDVVEEQLNRELSSCDELTLVVEGVMIPTHRGVMVYRLQGKSFRPYTEIPRPRAKAQPGMWARWHGLKRGLIAAGVDVVETATLQGTAAELVAAYKSSQKEEHTTLKRYMRPHIPPFSPNIHVENLSRLKGANVGPVLAQKLVDQFGTFHAAVTAHRASISSIIGRQRMINFLKVIGREDELG